MLDNFEWPKPDGAPDEVLFRNVRERGCHLMSIAADAEGAGYVFSTGLYLNYGHAELILFGLDPNDACVIINEVRDRAAAGRRYVAGDVCTDLPLDRKVCFVEVPLDAYQEYLGDRDLVLCQAAAAVSVPANRVVGPRRAISLGDEVRRPAQGVSAGFAVVLLIRPVCLRN